MDSRTSSGRPCVGMITDTSGHSPSAWAGASVMGVLFLRRAARGSNAVAQHEGQGDRRDDEAVAPGHAGAPGFVGTQRYLPVAEPRRVSGKAVAGAEPDPPVTDMRQVARGDSKADPGQCGRHGLPRAPDEV